MIRIAVHPDHHTVLGNLHQSFSDQWVEAGERLGISVELVNAYDRDFLETIKRYDAFLWRYAGPSDKEWASRLLPSVHQGVGIPVFPSTETIWHSGDKISGQILLKSAGVPTPDDWWFFDKEEALRFCAKTRFPVVFKLAGGAGKSENVTLVKDKASCEKLVGIMFSCGMESIWEASGSQLKIRLRALRYAFREIFGISTIRQTQKNYAYFQQYLPNNPGDVRLQVIGTKVFAFRRQNRENDFRASGSGIVDYDPTGIGRDLAEFGWQASRNLAMPFCSLDVIFDEGVPKVIEINYNYVAEVVRKCPGFWDFDNGGEWVAHNPGPEACTLEEFLRIHFPNEGHKASPAQTNPEGQETP